MLKKEVKLMTELKALVAAYATAPWTMKVWALTLLLSPALFPLLAGIGEYMLNKFIEGKKYRRRKRR
jgi:hypothetical protein